MLSYKYKKQILGNIFNMNSMKLYFLQEQFAFNIDITADNTFGYD